MKMIRNTLLSLTLLVSVPVLYAEDVQPGADQDQIQSQTQDSPSESQAAPSESQSSPSESTDDKPAVGATDVKSSGEGEKQDPQGPGMLKRCASGVAGFACLPFTGGMSVVDRIARMTWTTSMIEGIGNVGFLKENFVGRTFQNHKTGLARVIVLTGLGTAGYFAWNKYQEWQEQQEQDESFDVRAFFEDYDDFEGGDQEEETRNIFLSAE